MRRRVKELAPADTPPLPLTRYRGSSNREAVAWLEAREDWWTANKDADDSGWLHWILDGHDQVEPLPWCGSIGALCGDNDCMCAIWDEEHRAS